MNVLKAEIYGKEEFDHVIINQSDILNIAMNKNQTKMSQIATTPQTILQLLSQPFLNKGSRK